MNILRKHNSKKGTSTVEAVIILPILVMLTFGGLKYGLLFLRAQQITNVARQACRLAIRPYSEDTYGNAYVREEIDRLMAAISLGDVEYTPEYLTGEDSDIPVDNVFSMGSGDSLTLRVTVPTDHIDSLTLVNWLPLPDDIVAQVTMSKEGVNPTP